MLLHIAMVAKLLDLNKIILSCKYGRTKWHVWLSCAWTCTQEEIRSPYLLPLLNSANGHLCQRKIVEIQKSCHHGNLTSHFSYLIGPFIPSYAVFNQLTIKCLVLLYFMHIRVTRHLMFSFLEQTNNMSSLLKWAYCIVISKFNNVERKKALQINILPIF